MNLNTADILVIDDEPQIRKLLEITLQSNGYKVREAASGREGLALAASHPPDMILLDLGLPDESGQVVLRQLREWYNQPILILSVLSSEDAIVSALDGGANDYLVKPFRSGELLARIRSALRSATGEPENPVLVCGDLQIDLSLRTVKRNNEPVKLTATEYNLLALMAKNEGKVLTHQFLLRSIWGPSFVDQSQYLRVYVAQLRKKIETDHNAPVHLLTESGIGYRFV